MDERIHRLVMSQPIPLRLITAIELAPDLTQNRSASRVARARQHGVASLDPDDLTPNLLRTLILVCHGYTNEEIAKRTYYSLDTVRDRMKALFAIFDARGRAHLAALAVAQGYVDMKLAV